MNKSLARVRNAHLEIQERGILNFWINVDYEEFGSQCVGGICLDNYDKDLERRVGTAYGCEMIRQLLLVMEVNDFSEMKGKMIYVLHEGGGFNIKPKGIERLALDGGKSVVFDDVLNMFKNEVLK